MSLLSRHSPRRSRARKEQDQGRVGETRSPTLSPVIKKLEPDRISDQQQMLEAYSYTPTDAAPEPQQLNRAQEPEPEPKPTIGLTFNLYDLSFFCEERIYNLLFTPGDIKTIKSRQLSLKYIQDKLEIYSEYSQEATLGSFQDTIYFYGGEVLIPEEFVNISGFMRKFLGINQVHVLYETGEILLRETEYCNFWLNKVSQFFEPVDIPLDRPKILDEEICLDCNLKCIFRHRQQMNN